MATYYNKSDTFVQIGMRVGSIISLDTYLLNLLKENKETRHVFDVPMNDITCMLCTPDLVLHFPYRSLFSPTN